MVMPLLGIPSLILSANAWRGIQDAWETVSERRRLEWHLYRLATTARAGKEVRIFGLGPELLRRHRQVRRIGGQRRGPGRAWAVTLS